MARGVDPIGAIIENLFTIRRIGNTVNAESQRILDALFDSVVEDLRKIDPTGPALDKWKRYRTEQFIEAAGQRISSAMPDWEKSVKGGLAEAARSQGKFYEGVLVASLGGQGLIKPTPITQARARSIMNTLPFQGHTLKEWAGGLDVSTHDAIVRQVRLGMVSEESIPDLVRRIRGGRAGAVVGVDGVLRPRYVGGVYQTTTRNAEAVVRTGTTYISNMSALETYRANANLLIGIQYSATLDDRTTIICINLDGTIWEVGSSEIVIPGDRTHVACRSLLIPVPDYAAAGLEPPDDGFRKARDLSGLTDEELNKRVSARRSGGQLGRQTDVSSKVTAEDWLKRQDARIQDKMLGKERAQLFRDGKLDIKDMVRNDNSIVPLRELRGPPTPTRPSFAPAREIGEKLETLATTNAQRIAGFSDELAALNKQQAELQKIIVAEPRDSPRLAKLILENDDILRKQETIRQARLRINEEYFERVKSTLGRDVGALNAVEISARPAVLSKYGVKTGLDDFRSLVHKKWLEGQKVGIGPSSKRAYQKGKTIYLPKDVGPNTVVHELGHILEEVHEELRIAARKFWEKRTQGEGFRKLNTTSDFYDDAELAKFDKWFDPYVGKIYDKNSEIISMGLEAMARDPVKFWKADPEHFEFIWAIMNGEVPVVARTTATATRTAASATRTAASATRTAQAARAVGTRAEIVDDIFDARGALRVPKAEIDDIQVLLAKHNVDVSMEDFVRRMAAVPDEWGLQVKSMKIDGDKLTLQVKFFNDQREHIGDMDRIIDFGKGLVDHHYIELFQRAQGKGAAKNILSQQVALYQELGLKKIKLKANLSIGQYAWGRYGFTPINNSTWKRLRDQLTNHLAITNYREEFGDELYDAVLAILKNPDRDALRLLVQNPVGKEMLIRSRVSWNGALDLTDDISMQQFWAYVDPT